MVLNIVLFPDFDCFRVVEEGTVFPVIVRVVILSVIRGVDGIDLATFLLGKSHEDDWALCDDRIDDNSREDNDKDGAKGEAEVALPTAHIPVRMFQEETEGRTARQTLDVIVRVSYYLFCHFYKDILFSKITNLI